MNDTVKRPPAQTGATDTPVMGATSQPIGLEAADADQAMASGQSWKISQFVMEQRTDWNGLTEEEKLAQEQEEAEEARRLQEYMEENERQFQSMMRDLRERDRQCVEHMQKMENNTYHLGGDKKKAVFVDQFGRFVDANGNLLEGDAKTEAEEARKKGSHFEKWEDFEKAKKQHETYAQQIEEAERRHAERKRAMGEAAGRGDYKAATTEAEKDRAQIETARDKIEIHQEVRAANNVSAQTAVVKNAEGSDDDFGDTDSYHTASAGSVTTRNTSLANQADPVPGQLALKPTFTASANPLPSADPAPVIGQKNTVTAPGPVAA